MKNTYLVIFRESTAECAPKAQPIYDFLETLEDCCKLKDGVYGVATELTRDDIEKSGKDIVIGFNPKFLIDALRVIDDENVTELSS